jgi:hypothetical protein
MAIIAVRTSASTANCQQYARLVLERTRRLERYTAAGIPRSLAKAPGSHEIYNMHGNLRKGVEPLVK